MAIKCKACGGTGVDEAATEARLQDDVSVVVASAARDGEDPALWARKRWLAESAAGNDSTANSLFDVIEYFQSTQTSEAPT